MTSPLTILFAGTPEFAATTLRALLTTEHRICAVYTQPDRPAGRGRKLTPSAVKQLALERGITVLQPPTLKEEQQQQVLRDFNADIMVVVAYGLLLPQAVLDAPKYGCINVHASLLPRWRGAAPIQRAISSGDTETGVTIMQMDKGLDTGAMLHKVSTPISDEDTSQSLHDRLAELGASALIETLNQLVAGRLVPVPQDNTKATYAEKIQKSEALIDWRNPARVIHRQIRAFNPWPVAQTILNGNTLRIWQAEVLPDNTSALAGTVIEASKNGVDVATGDGVIRLVTLQLPGARPLAAVDFINAQNLTGQVLGK
jgi:methionyl-tRNA formyltransferase